jgi:nucleotide-binding universal stress UspA family protein
MKILIGVDDSPHSKAAVEFVRRMSWPVPTHVIVMSVVQSSAIVYADAYVPAGLGGTQTLEQMLRDHQSIAADAERALRVEHLGTEAKVLEGDPRTALVQAAKEENADLIVVGSHGRTGIAKLLMGSVASHVVTHAPCSVLVVKMERR